MGILDQAHQPYQNVGLLSQNRDRALLNASADPSRLNAYRQQNGRDLSPEAVGKAWYDWRTSLPPPTTMDAAMGFMPMGMAAGAIKAFHGSPHSFDAFDLGKIGTGEGAQAYGHGLYFAGNEATARSYRDALSGAGSTPTNDVAKYWLGRAQGSQSDALKLFDQYLEHSGQDVTKSYDLQKIRDAIAKPPGHMYEVNIDAEPHQLLDWDKPLSQQPKAASDLLQSMKPAIRNQSDWAWPWPIDKNFRSGQAIHNNLPGGKEGAAALLNESGIPGIQYLDQGSRAAGDGTRNYVIFNPDIIKILRRYGIAPAALTGGAAALSGQQGQQ